MFQGMFTNVGTSNGDLTVVTEHESDGSELMCPGSMLSSYFTNIYVKIVWWVELSMMSFLMIYLC